MAWRDRVAHAATPWRWRSRHTVMALVALAALLAVIGVVIQARRDAPVPGMVLNLAIWWLVGIWPAIRSLKRWDAAHFVPPQLP